MVGLTYEVTAGTARDVQGGRRGERIGRKVEENDDWWLASLALLWHLGAEEKKGKGGEGDNDSVRHGPGFYNCDATEISPVGAEMKWCGQVHPRRLHAVQEQGMSRPGYNERYRFVGT
jgi:hypothetical protein